MNEFYLYLLMLFMAKVIDNGLSTAKTLLLQRGRWILAGVCVSLSTFIYFYIAKLIVTAQSNIELGVVALASGAGCMMACLLGNSLSKDRTYVNVIMSDDISQMKMLRNFLAENHITNVATDSYGKDWGNKTITITAYASTKAESRLIDEYLAKSYHRFESVNDFHI